MNALSPESVRSLLVSSFENCTIEKAQRIVDRYEAIPLSPRSVYIEKDQGEREQGFLIRRIKHPESSDAQFLLINDLADFQNPNVCLVIAYNIHSKHVIGYQKCKYVLYFTATASQKELAVQYYETFSKSNQLQKIVSRPIAYLTLYLHQCIFFRTSLTVYVVPPQELYSFKSLSKLINSLQIGFLLSEELPKENGLTKRSYSHMITCETYAYQTVKCLITYAIFGGIVSWIAIFLLRSLIAIF